MNIRCENVVEERFAKIINKNKTCENGANIDEKSMEIDVGMDVAAEMKNAPSKCEFLLKCRTLAF